MGKAVKAALLELAQPRQHEKAWVDQIKNKQASRGMMKELVPVTEPRSKHIEYREHEGSLTTRRRPGRKVPAALAALRSVLLQVPAPRDDSTGHSALCVPSYVCLSVAKQCHFQEKILNATPQYVPQRPAHSTHSPWVCRAIHGACEAPIICGGHFGSEETLQMA